LKARSANTVAPRRVEPSVEAPASSLGGVVPTGVTARPVGGEAARRRTTEAQRREANRPIAIPREQEYRFIRADLRRLVITATALLVFMLLLLALVD